MHSWLQDHAVSLGKVLWWKCSHEGWEQHVVLQLWLPKLSSAWFLLVHWTKNSLWYEVLRIYQCSCGIVVFTEPRVIGHFLYPVKIVHCWVYRVLLWVSCLLFSWTFGEQEGRTSFVHHVTSGSLIAFPSQLSTLKLLFTWGSGRGQARIRLDQAGSGQNQARIRLGSGWIRPESG